MTGFAQFYRGQWVALREGERWRRAKVIAVTIDCIGVASAKHLYRFNRLQALRFLRCVYVVGLETFETSRAGGARG